MQVRSRRGQPKWGRSWRKTGQRRKDIPNMENSMPKAVRHQGLNMGLKVYKSPPLQGLALGPICQIELWDP